MTIEQAVYERLSDLSALVALVSTRIYQLVLRQNRVLPAVRMAVIPGMQGQHLRGPDGLWRTRVQIDAYAKEADGIAWYSQAAAVAAAVRGDGLGSNATGLWGWIGESGGSPAEIGVQNVELTHSGMPEYEAGEEHRVRIRQEYVVVWRELSM